MTAAASARAGARPAPGGWLPALRAASLRAAWSSHGLAWPACAAFLRCGSSQMVVQEPAQRKNPRGLLPSPASLQQRQHPDQEGQGCSCQQARGVQGLWQEVNAGWRGSGEPARRGGAPPGSLPALGAIPKSSSQRPCDMSHATVTSRAIPVTYAHQGASGSALAPPGKLLFLGRYYRQPARHCLAAHSSQQSRGARGRSCPGGSMRQCKSAGRRAQRAGPSRPGGQSASWVRQVQAARAQAAGSGVGRSRE